MKFYIIENNVGETIGCEITVKAARQHAEGLGYQRYEYDLIPINCKVTAETVRRLLGELGGYAN